jgi:UDP-2-acetamido-2-deoxy-ribo-hexuluronate aminotransferase
LEPHNVSVYAQYTVRVDRRELLQEKLKIVGVPTAVHYPIPLNKQPAVQDLSISLPIGDEMATQVMSLPMSPTLTSAQQVEVVQALTTALDELSN